MNKTVKNLLLVFTLICAIVLIVFIIELFIVNRDSDDGGESVLSASDITPAETEKSPEMQPLALASNSPSSANKENLPQESTTRPAGKRYDLLYTHTESLVLYADEELFDYNAELEMAAMFSYKDDDTASLLICFDTYPQGAEKRAETFLDGYLDGNESFVSGMGPIRHSSLTGVFVSGVNNGETFEAWIHSIPGNDSDVSNDDNDDIGLEFVIRYKDNEQKNALYAILDTLEIIEN